MSAETKSLNWFAVGMIVAAGALSFGVIALMSEVEVTNYAFSAGKYLVRALLVACVIYFVLLRDYGSKAFAPLFICVFGGLFIGYSVHHDRYNAESAKLLENIKEVHKEVIENSFDEDGYPIINDVPVSQTSPLQGSAKNMDQFIRWMMQANVNLSNDYLRELDEIGLEGMIDPEKLARQDGLAESQAKLPLLKKAVEKHRTKFFAFLDGIPDSVRASEISPDSQRGFIRGFMSQYKKKQNLFSKKWDYEALAMDRLEDILTMLEETSDNWAVEDGQLLFGDDETTDRYNRLYEDLVQVFVEQDEVEQELAASSRLASP